MKKVVAIFALFFGVSFANANSNAIGLGLSNNGWVIDYKRHINTTSALDIYLNNLHFAKNRTEFGVSAGYYFLYPKIIKVDASAGSIPLYWGPNFGIGYWSGGRGAGSWRGFDIGANLVGGISWFLPTDFKMDISLELLSPSLGFWHQAHKQDNAKWETDDNSGFGLRDYLGIRLLFHVYFF
jgi:hypothetical protein